MKILIVEDDEALGQAMAGLLAEAGHRAVPVANGRQALRELRSGEKTCLILLDLTMPVMNGWQFREEQLKDAALAGIPVILCTADGRATETVKAIGAAGWLRKPVDPDRLLRVVHEHCRDADRHSTR